MTRTTRHQKITDVLIHAGCQLVGLADAEDAVLELIEAAYEEGYDDGLDASTEDAFDEGKAEGYDSGYEEGHAVGMAEAGGE